VTGHDAHSNKQETHQEMR